MVSGSRNFFPFVRNTRIEDKRHIAFDEPGNVSVGKLCRVTFRLTRDRLDAKLVDLVAGLRGQHDLKTEFFKEGCPVREIFVHVEDTRDADDASGRLVGSQRLIVEESVILPCKEVRDVTLCLFHTETALTAVSGNILTSAFEPVDRQDTVVYASAAAAHGGRVGQIDYIIQREHRRLMGTVHVALTGDQCCAEGTHDTCDIRADGIAAGDPLEASEDCVIVESSALHNDVLSEITGGGDLDDLKQGVLDHRVSEAGGDIRNRSPLFLRLFYVGVHEYGTSRSEIHRILGKKCRFCKILNAVV